MDFSELELNKIQKTNENLKKIVAIIMCDFYELVFAEKEFEIKSLNQLLYPDSKTFFNEEDEPTLLEKIIIYYNEKEALEEIELDQCFHFQISECVKNNLIELTKDFKYKLDEATTNDLINKITYVLTRINEIKEDLEYSLRETIESIICHHDNIEVFNSDIQKMVFLKDTD